MQAELRDRCQSVPGVELPRDRHRASDYGVAEARYVDHFEDLPLVIGQSG
jgi:hypothetical protein